MGRLNNETSHIAIAAMVELSPCHTEFLENGVSGKEEEEIIRKFMATGTF